MQIIRKIILLMAATLFLSACVTVHHQDGSKTVWNPIEKLTEAFSEKPDRIEIYTALNDSAWWSLWESMRKSASARRVMQQDTFRIKFFPTSESSVVPMVQYEIMVAHNREKAYSFLDYLAADPAILNKDGMEKRHAKMDMWVDKNWPGGGEAFIVLIKQEAHARLMGTKSYLHEFNALRYKGHFPAIIINGKADPDARAKLFRSDEKK